jgi:uncharacterized membrane protein
MTVHAGDTLGQNPVPIDAGAHTAPGVPGLMERLEDAESLDATAEALWDVLPDWVVTGWGRELLGGTWLGHSLHPLLTDFPLGCWSSATLLDLLGGGRYADAARRLVGLGLAASLPTAAAGLSDWSRLEERDRRVGLVHGQLNTLALVLYGASYVARRRRGSGVALGVLGSLAAVASGYLGGHLTTTRAVTRDNRLLDAPVSIATTP